DAKAGYTMFPSNRSVIAWHGARSIQDLQSYTAEQVQLTTSGTEPVSLFAAKIGSGFMRFAGVGTLFGRNFDTTETQAGAARVAILSEHLWRGRFAASRAVLGRRITLDDSTYTIIGVARDALRLPAALQPTTDIWLPAVVPHSGPSAAVIARLRPGVTVEAAQRELDSLSTRSEGAGEHFQILLQRPRDSIYIRSTLYLFAIAAAAIFLIACANVAHLVLARNAARERELAIRGALGASWSRLARQLVTESLIIAGAGGALGVALAVASLRWLTMIRPTSMAALDRASLDRPVLLLAVFATAATGVAFGLVGATRRSRRDTDAALKSTAMSGTSTRGQARARALLVATEMALSALLLVGAVLVVRSVLKLQQVDPGFDANQLYAIDVRAASRGPRGLDDGAKATVDALAERAKALPGVSSVAVASSTPPQIGMMVMPLEVQTPRGSRIDSGTMFIPDIVVRPTFFSALGIRFRDGGTFSAAASSQHEVVVNESLARRLWPAQRAIGQHLRFAASDPKDADAWNTVVGVANDIAIHGLTTIGEEPLLYFPDAGNARDIVFRTSQPNAVLRELERTAKQFGGPAVKLTLVDVQADLARTTATQRFSTLLLTGFAVIALVLAAIGLYGVLAYSVAQRTREIGVRMAIGASPAQVARGVVRGGLTVSMVGLAIGLTAAIWGTKLVQTILFGVTQHDPASYVISAVVLTIVAVAACAIPTRRAMAVDPVIAMRGDADRSW
ncbi:MAG TPA: FtsX-like permease family protein, partial [Gemmatimonadaceae bacterium]|nr:FtsX-like permease family protein [Gemmatimonadaceae bacterium]